jgi:integrase
MPRLTKTLPSYRLHRTSGQALVTLDGRDFYLGRHGTRSSRAEYDRLIGEWLAHGRRLPPAPEHRPELTVDDLILRYWRFAQGHYRRGGVPSRELDNIRDALRHVRPLYGPSPAAGFGPKALKAVRRAMVDAGLSRTTINARVGKIRRMFKWAVAEELLPAAAYQGLLAVEGLRAGRDGAREAAPVRPVPEAHIDAVLPHVSKPVRAMIELQNLTGMRPGEVMAMRGADLDRGGPVWTYRPARHKTSDRGFDRVIALGPRAQAIVSVWLKDDPAAYLFSPADAVAGRNLDRRRRRRSPMTPSQARRRPKPDPKRAPRDHYDKRTYNTAIERACAKAGVPRWHPNQLRHTAATRIRRLFSLEAAQVVLGHSRADVTQVYAERDAGKAFTIMAEIG